MPVLVATAPWAGCGGAPPAPPDAGLPPGLAAADSLVEEWVAGERISAAVLVVAEEGRVLLAGAHGSLRLFDYGEGQYGAWGTDAAPQARLRRVAGAPPVEVGTLFDLASVTKVMATTMGVMLLVDRGRMELSAPVSTYLPELRGTAPGAATLEQLLTHRSGLAQWQPVYYHAADREAALRFIRDLPLPWATGEGRHYSDLGFMLLGLAVERVTGQGLDAYLRDALYEPLGLRHTGFRPAGLAPPIPQAGVAATSHGNPFEHRMVHDSTFGYRVLGDPDAWGGWRRSTLSGEVNDGNAWHAFGGVAGHAGLFSTAPELAVLLRLLLDRGAHQGRRIVRAEVVDTFLAARPDAQALGWQLPAWAPAGSFAHTGFTGTLVLGIPERGLAIVLLTARQNVGVDAATQYPDVGPLQRGVVEAITGAADGGGPPGR